MCVSRKFDAIMVCNGHYSSPNIPDFKGLDDFVGKKQHSHDYRQPDHYENETVLIIGAGPSANDIAFEIATKAKRVIWSQHKNFLNFTLPANMKKVGDVRSFTTTSVQLESGEEETISYVLFCTGT